MISTAKLGTLLTVLGTMLIAAALLYSYTELQALDDQIRKKEITKEQLDVEIEKKKGEIYKLINDPLWNLAEVRVLAVKAGFGPGAPPDRKEAQLYDFSFWIDVPNNRKNDIKEIRFLRLAGEKLRPLVGTEPSNGFSDGYLGWGCFRTVDVTIVEKDTAEETTKRINQCELLGPGWRN
jgi:hypothetical protein